MAITPRRGIRCFSKKMVWLSRKVVSNDTNLAANLWIRPLLTANGRVDSAKRVHLRIWEKSRMDLIHAFAFGPLLVLTLP